MANEPRGLYVLQDGVLIPAATVPGSKGNPGDKGDPGQPGPPGTAAVGVIVSDTPPANPTTQTVWLNSSGGS